MAMAPRCSFSQVHRITHVAMSGSNSVLNVLPGPVLRAEFSDDNLDQQERLFANTLYLRDESHKHNRETVAMQHGRQSSLLELSEPGVGGLIITSPPPGAAPTGTGIPAGAAPTDNQ